MEQKIKTLPEYNRDLKKCSYCKRLGYDIFDISKPCPNCSKNTLVIIKNKSMTKNEFQELTGENSRRCFRRRLAKRSRRIYRKRKRRVINNKINHNICENQIYENQRDSQ